MLKKGKIFGNLSKNVQDLKQFWKRIGDCVWLSHAINCWKRLCYYQSCSPFSKCSSLYCKIRPLCTCYKMINVIILTFSIEICQNMNLGFEIEKINVGIRISIPAILCVSIFRQNRQLWHNFDFFWPKFAQI